MSLEWQELLKKMLEKVRNVVVSDHASERLIIESCRHWDGHVREAAVRKLGDAQSTEAFLALLVRLNDWVPQVRAAAAEACANYVSLERLDGILACLDSVLALSRKSRADHSAFLDRVGAVLDMPESRDAVLQFFPGSHGEVARYLLAHMLAREGADHVEVMILAARHLDFTVRAAFIEVCKQRECPHEVLRKLLGDAHPMNRKAAFEALWHKTHNVPEQQELLRAALLDKALCVRELALHCARQTEFDVTAFVEQQAADTPDSDDGYVGLLGLIGMLATPHYLPLIQLAFDHPRPALRRAALAAWASISRETADSAATRALTDPSGKVAKLAKQLAMKNRVVLSRDQLLEAAEQALVQQETGRLTGISRLMPFWDRFECLVGSLRHLHTQKDQREILFALKQWEQQQRYTFLSLPEEQRWHLLELIEQSRLAAILARNPDVQLAMVQFESNSN